MQIGNGVGQIGRALDRGVVDAVFDGAGKHARHDGGSGNLVPPRRRQPLFVERRAQAIEGGGPVVVMAHVVFARPHQFDRRTHGHGKLHRLGHEVLFRAPPEATAEESGVYFYLVRRQAGNLHRDELRAGLRLGWHPQFTTVLLHQRRAIHRFHAGVRGIGRLVDGLNGFGGSFQCLGHITFSTRGHAFLFERALQLLANPGATQLRVCALLPCHHQRFASALRGPETIRHHRHAGMNGNHLQHTRHGARRGGVELPELPAEHRATRHQGHQQAGHLYINAKHSAAVDLERRVAPRHRLADEFELARLFQKDFARLWQARGLCGQFAVTRTSLARRVSHDTVLGTAFILFHFPILGSSTNQQCAPGRTGLTQRRPEGAHRGAATGELLADKRVGVRLICWGHFHLDARPVTVEFLGEQHGDGGMHALPHFRAADPQRDGVVRVDTYPGIRCKFFCGHGGIHFTHPACQGQMETDEQTAACRRTGPEKTPTLRIYRFICCVVFHSAAPLAFSATACLMAPRMRE